MNKYDQYYRISSVRRKRTLRKKPTFSFLKPLFLFCLFVACCIGGYRLAKYAYYRIATSQMSAWVPTAVRVSGVDEPIKQAIVALAQTKLNRPFTVHESVQLQHQIMQNYPQLRDVRVKRHLWTHTLKITVQTRVPMAQFHHSDGSIHFIDQDGTVYTYPQADTLPQVPVVEFDGAVPPQLDKELVDLIESTLNLKSQLNYEKLHFDLAHNTVKMQLPDGCLIDFGTAKKLRQKARRAAQIEKVAQGKAPYPHIVDFTYFDDGKVFLRQRAL